MMIEIKENEIKAMKWLLLKGMEQTNSNRKFEIFERLSDELQQSPETGQVDAIVIGDAIATASNVIRFLSALTHGLATGKRVDLLDADFQNAKDHFEILTDIIENRQ